MAAKSNSRNWNDVQTAIATVAIVTTLGMWNLFATPSKPKASQASEPTIPPTEPPVESTPTDTAASVPTAMPQVKIMFAAGATPQPSLQPAPAIQQVQPVKKKNRNNGGGGGGGSGTVTQTKTS